MKKNKFIILTLFLVVSFFIQNKNIEASSITCEYKHANITYTCKYKYGTKLKCESSSTTHKIKTPLSIANTAFVNSETGEVSCPILYITSTPKEKNRWEVTINTKSTMVHSFKAEPKTTHFYDDGKEKEEPFSNNTVCKYNLNDFNYYQYTLLWTGEKVSVDLIGDRLQGYTYTIRNCGAEDFENGCPKVHDQLVAKAKNIIIDCKNDIFMEGESTNNPDGSYNVDEGENPEKEPEKEPEKDDNNNKGQEIKDKYIGDLTCSGAGKFYFPKALPDFTKTLYNFIKLLIPIILIIKGMIDMLKATSSSKEDEMKKAQKKFIQRLIAGLCGFILFILVETIIEWIDDRTGNEGAMNCVNCFINGSENCTVRSNSEEVDKADTAFYVPIPQGISYSITSEYGNRINPKTGKQELHKGIDLDAPDGTNIVASADGKVIKAEFHKDFGNHVCIEHTYNNKKYYTTYMHLSELKVNVNQKVKAKQVIGVIGATGQVTGVHLHFEISTSPTVHSDKCFNPKDFITF